MTTIERAITNALTAEKAAGPKPEVIVVTPEKDSTLETLLVMYESRKGAYDAAKEQWEEYHGQLVAALRAYEGDENVKVYEVPGTRMWPAITVAWQNGREYLPTELIRQHIPQVWDAFKATTKGYWVIRRAGKKRG